MHCKKEPYDVYIGRPGKWGNPFPIRLSLLGTYEGFKEIEGSRAWSIDEYRKYIMTNKELLKDIHELRGKTLGCWCKPQACHGDILAELADACAPKELANAGTETDSFRK